MRLALAVHLLLAAGAAAAALVAWSAAGRAERGEPGLFARSTAWLGLLLLAQLIAGLWVLGFVPLARGRRLLGEDGLGTGALVALLLLLVAGTRLAWTAHRRPRPRRVAALLLGLLAAAAILMAAVVLVLRAATG